MGFGDKFNKWRIERGRESVSPKTIKSLNRLMEQIIADMRKDQDFYVLLAQEAFALNFG